MKKLFLTLLFILTTTLTYSQTAAAVANPRAIPQVAHYPYNLLSCNPVPNASINTYIKDSLYWYAYQIPDLKSTVENFSDLRYKPLAYTPNYTEIITGLGYVPYNTSNPSNYITQASVTWASLPDKPSIPAAQVPSDWNSGTSPTQILNKPILTKYYNSGGQVNQAIKIWTADNITPSASSGYSVDISSAGFTTLLSVQITGFENVATEKGVVISGKTKSTTAIVVNSYRSKNTGVLIGGNIEGLEFHPTPANVRLSVTVIGY